MLYNRLPRVAFKYTRFKLQRAHPLTLTLALAGVVAAMLVLLTIEFARAGDSRSIAPQTRQTQHAPLLPDARENAAQIRFDDPA